MRTLFFTRTFFLWIGLLIGCTQENTEDCLASLELRFDFSHHTDQGNLFGPEVQVVRVYCFDRSGILRHIAQESGAVLTNDYTMPIALPPGTYTIVAWGGSQKDFFNSYREVEMVNPATHTYTDGVTVGRTQLNDFRVLMDYHIADDLPEDVVPSIEEIDDLYYGAVGRRDPNTSVYRFEQVEIKSGVVAERSIELIRNTNLIQTTITGIEYLDRGLGKAASGGGFQLWAVAKNGRYGFDNSIEEYARTIRYTPHYVSIDEHSLVADIKLLRLDLDRHTAEPILLYIETPDGRRFPEQPIDVVATLLQAIDPATGTYIYNTQSDLDKIYQHPIEIRIGVDLRIELFVGDWQVIDIKPAA